MGQVAGHLASHKVQPLAWASRHYRSDRSAAADAPWATIAQVHDSKEIAASLELVDSPVWLYDPAAHRNLWGNR
jgi:hypothetical protein